LGATWDDIELELAQHFAYLWLTPAEIASATTVVDGLTTVFDMPTLTIDQLWDSLIAAAIAGF